MSINVLVVILIFLIVLSGVFSSSETGMMSLNRYRLRHKAQSGDKVAKRVTTLLTRPDRLLGVILIGNTFANILASAVATVIAVHYFGEFGVLFMSIALAVVILIFAETAPKTVAALYPERIAFRFSLFLSLLLRVFYPFVWLVNTIANGLLRLFKVKVKKSGVDSLSADELRTVVLDASGKISTNYQRMLLRILDLGRVVVEDIMVLRGDIFAIDMGEDMDHISERLLQCTHAFVPVYNGNIDQPSGIINVRKALNCLAAGSLSHAQLEAMQERIYFIPEGVALNQLLLNFQDQKHSVGLVVDEYGEIQGLVALRDILEEIVGEFDKVKRADISAIVCRQKNGSVLVDGGVHVRELNRLTGWLLPVKGPKTLSGLLIEYLEFIPREGVGMRVAGYPMEVVEVGDNTIEKVRVWPDLYV